MHTALYIKHTHTERINDITVLHATFNPKVE